MTLQKLTLFSCFLFSLNFGSATYAGDSPLQDTIDRLFEHARTSIEKIEEGRIVFYPEKTCLHKGKIYVEGEDGQPIDLSPAQGHLFYNESGLFIQAAKKEQTILYICSNCTRTQKRNPSNNIPPKRCPICLNSDFLVRYQ